MITTVLYIFHRFFLYTDLINIAGWFVTPSVSLSGCVLLTHNLQNGGERTKVHKGHLLSIGFQKLLIFCGSIFLRGAAHALEEQRHEQAVSAGKGLVVNPAAKMKDTGRAKQLIRNLPLQGSANVLPGLRMGGIG